MLTWLDFRVRDTQGMAAMRARQHTRVFRQLGFDGRSEEMWRIIDAMEKRCSHNSKYHCMGVAVSISVCVLQ